MATKYPPYLTIAEAIKVIKEIYTIHRGKEVSLDLMPEILGVKKGSSYFPAKITALQKFGLVEKRPNEIIELTDLSMQIINPIGGEINSAIMTLFKKDEVLSALIDKYPNGKLPSPDQLKQTLMKQFEVPRATINRWYSFVNESFREFPNASENQEGTKQNEVPKGDSFNKDFFGFFPKAKEVKYQNFELPSGKKFSFYLEDEFTLDDIGFILDFFELKQKRMAK